VNAPSVPDMFVRKFEEANGGGSERSRARMANGVRDMHDLRQDENMALLNSARELRTREDELVSRALDVLFICVYLCAGGRAGGRAGGQARCVNHTTIYICQCLRVYYTSIISVGCNTSTRTHTHTHTHTHKYTHRW
jgi:hypothetical protein